MKIKWIFWKYATYCWLFLLSKHHLPALLNRTTSKNNWYLNLKFHTSIVCTSCYFKSHLFTFQTHLSISVDRFERLENEISDLKGIVDELRQKLAKFESSGPSTKDDASGAPRKGNSVDYSSPAIPAAAITGPLSCQELLDLNNNALRTNGFYIVGNKVPNGGRMMVVNCNFDNAGKFSMIFFADNFFVVFTTRNQLL